MTAGASGQPQQRVPGSAPEQPLRCPLLLGHVEELVQVHPAVSEFPEGSFLLLLHLRLQPGGREGWKGVSGPPGPAFTPRAHGKAAGTELRRGDSGLPRFLPQRCRAQPRGAGLPPW